MARATEKREDGDNGARRVRQLPRFSRKVFHRKRRGAQGARNSRKPKSPSALTKVAEPIRSTTAAASTTKSNPKARAPKKRAA